MTATKDSLRARRAGAAVSLMLVAMLGLAGCSMSMPSNESAPDMGYDGGSPGSSGDLGGGDDAVSDEDRQVIVTGYVTLTVEKPMEAASEAATIVEKAGGRVDSRVEVAPRDNDRGRAELVLRIPANKVSGTLDALKELGTLEQTQLSKEDVTSVTRDLDARITALRTSVDRLLAMMASATDTSDLITIESALSQRQAELESLQSQRNSISEKVEYSTITLTLRSVADAPVEQPNNFFTGIVTGWNALVVFVSFLLVALGVVLPWLILPTIALLVVWWAVRRSMKKKAAATGASTQPPAQGPPPAPEPPAQQ